MKLIKETPTEALPKGIVTEIWYLAQRYREGDLIEMILLATMMKQSQQPIRHTKAEPSVTQPKFSGRKSSP
jgi:hypothetical protein